MKKFFLILTLIITIATPLFSYDLGWHSSIKIDPKLFCDNTTITIGLFPQNTRAFFVTHNRKKLIKSCIEIPRRLQSFHIPMASMTEESFLVVASNNVMESPLGHALLYTILSHHRKKAREICRLLFSNYQAQSIEGIDPVVVALLVFDKKDSYQTIPSILENLVHKDGPDCFCPDCITSALRNAKPYRRKQN